MSVTNLENNKVDDLATTYDISGGSKLFKKPSSRNKSFAVQVVWENLDQLDGKIVAQGSNNDVNFDDMPLPNSINLDSANGSASLLCRTEFDFEHLGMDYDAGTATSGTIKLLLSDN